MSEEYSYIAGQKEAFPKRNVTVKLSDKPGYLLRGNDFGFKDTLEDIVNEVSLLRKGLDELENDFNIRMIKREFVIGIKDPDLGFSADTLVEEITGENLVEIKDLPDSIINEAEALVRSLLKYLKQKINNKEGYLSDLFKAEDFVYGSKQDQLNEKHIYLVDVGAGVLENQENKAYTRINLGDLLDFCNKLESKNSKINLTDIKGEINSIVSTLR